MKLKQLILIMRILSSAIIFVHYTVTTIEYYRHKLAFRIIIFGCNKIYP